MGGWIVVTHSVVTNHPSTCALLNRPYKVYCCFTITMRIAHLCSHPEITPKNSFASLLSKWIWLEGIQ